MLWWTNDKYKEEDKEDDQCSSYLHVEGNAQSCHAQPLESLFANIKGLPELMCTLRRDDSHKVMLSMNDLRDTHAAIPRSRTAC